MPDIYNVRPGYLGYLTQDTRFGECEKVLDNECGESFDPPLLLIFPVCRKQRFVIFPFVNCALTFVSRSSPLTQPEPQIFCGVHGRLGAEAPSIEGMVAPSGPCIEK